MPSYGLSIVACFRWSWWEREWWDKPNILHSLKGSQTKDIFIGSYHSQATFINDEYLKMRLWWRGGDMVSDWLSHTVLSILIPANRLECKKRAPLLGLAKSMAVIPWLSTKSNFVFRGSFVSQKPTYLTNISLYLFLFSFDTRARYWH